MFSFMAYGNLATTPKRLESELPVFRIEHSFIYYICFSYWNFFRYLFVLTYFVNSRRHTHTTTHATGTQIVRAKMTSLDMIFCRGNKSGFRSLARFCRRKHKKSTACASRSWKNLSSTRRQVQCSYRAINPTLESHAVHSVLFIFPILRSKNNISAKWEFSVLRLPLYWTQFTAVETFAKSLQTPQHNTTASVTELQVNLRICQELFKFLKFLLQHSLRKK